MTPVYEIPLQPGTPQQFTISLNGVTYQFTVKWNTANNSWIIDIADSSGNPIVNGIPMITGADLLEQFAYLGIGGQLIVQTDNDPEAVPTFSTVGITGHLYFIPEVAV